jgi:pyrroline-5-carboxylate reductase
MPAWRSHESHGMKELVFLGGGRITTALIAGLRLAGYKKPILVYDRNPHKLRKLKKDFGVEPEPRLASAVSRAKLLIIAVRPDAVRQILVETQLAVSRARQRQGPSIAISLAAGIPLKQLRTDLGPPFRWARAMPSPVCRTAKGLTGLAFSHGLNAGDRDKIRALFSRVGTVLDIPENQFDAFSVTYSSSHGYHALAALAESAIKVGLNRKAAFIAAAHALADGIDYWRQEKASLAELLNEAATPGGVAAATMAAMNKAGHRPLIEKGLRAGLARTRANATHS